MATIDIMTDNEENIKQTRNPRRDLEKKKDMRIRAKKMARRRRITALILTAIISLIVLTIMFVSSFISGFKSKDMISGVAPKRKESLNILLLGMDVGDVENSDAGKRTDTIMVLNYNPTTKNVQIVSIPRDTLIEVEDAYDEYGGLLPYWKINTAYALGGEEEVVTHVQDLLDIKINYIVEINYEAFRNIIDAIGGVEMYIENDMYYDDDAQNLHINFKEGETVLLDGKKAEEFFRWRKNNDGTGLEEGDLGRIKNQQMFISKVIDKCTSPSIIIKIPTIVDALQENIVTNMPGGKILSYGLKILKSPEKQMYTMQGYDEEIYGQSFLVVDKEDNKEIIKALSSGDTEEGSIEKSTKSIKVLNGTRVSGLAGNMQIKLEDIGYKNISIGNAERREDSIILCNDKSLRAVLSSQTGINNVAKYKEKEYGEYNAVIIIGEDYLVFGE